MGRSRSSVSPPPNSNQEEDDNAVHGDSESQQGVGGGGPPWLFQTKSLDEAIEWVKRSPNPFPKGDSEIEIRQVFEADDFGAEFTPELRKQEERVGRQMAENAKREPGRPEAR